MELEARINTELVQEAVRLNVQMKEIEARFEVVKAQLKSDMIANDVDRINYGGHTVTLATTLRRTPVKDILTRLASMGLGMCIKTEMKADVERLSMEVGSGLSQSEYDSLVKTSEVRSLTIK